MSPSDLATLDATAQAALVKEGQCAASDLVEAAVERIERIDPEINAVVTPLSERARKSGVERASAGPLSRRPASAEGSRLPREGRTRSPTTEPDTFGPTRNPWNPERIVGGSSGGSAEAVAAGLTPLAHAGDGGGSIRNPAGACGLVGLKPSRGRTSMGPGKGEGWAGCVTEHVVTRSVRDATAVLDCVAGPAPGDPYFAPPPPRPFAAELGQAPGRLRIGRFTQNDFTPAHPESVRAVEITAALLRELGHEVDDAYPSALDEEELSETTRIAVAASVARQIAEMEASVGEAVAPGDIEPVADSLERVVAWFPCLSRHILAQQDSPENQKNAHDFHSPRGPVYSLLPQDSCDSLDVTLDVPSKDRSKPTAPCVKPLEVREARRSVGILFDRHQTGS